MLTIREEGIHGDVSLFQAARVVHGTDVKNRNATTGKMLEFFDLNHDRSHGAVFFGRVFVMNEHGKTVAQFNLGGWEHAVAPPSAPDPSSDCGS